MTVLTSNTSLYGFASALEGIEEEARDAGFALGVRVMEPATPADVRNAVDRALEPAAAVIVIAFDRTGSGGVGLRAGERTGSRAYGSPSSKRSADEAFGVDRRVPGGQGGDRLPPRRWDIRLSTTCLSRPGPARPGACRDGGRLWRKQVYPFRNLCLLAGRPNGVMRRAKV